MQCKWLVKGETCKFGNDCAFSHDNALIKAAKTAAKKANPAPAVDDEVDDDAEEIEQEIEE